MRALLAIAWRELRERWTLPLAVFFGGFVPLVIAVRVGERALPIAGILMVPGAWAVAVILGSSVIARDLGEGRLGFFFARPVPWWAIAGGKLLAALLLTIATAIAAGLPSLLFEWNGSAVAGGLRSGLRDGGLAMNLALVAVLIGLGHAAGVVYRSRSTWAALDFLLFAAAAAAAVLLFRAFVRLGILVPERLPSPWVVALGLLLVALVPLGAAAAQVAWGRSDLQRGHRALSLTLWAGALAWLVVLGGLLARELRATPADFARRGVVEAAGDGRFLTLAASDRGRHASFVLDTASGRSLRTPSFARFTADGRLAVWEEEGPLWRFRRRELRLARLDGAAPSVETVALEPPLPEEPVRWLALDAEAARVAIVQAHTLSVHELPSGRTLSRAAAADDDWAAAVFLPDGRLRALRRVRPVVGGPGRQVIPGFLEAVELAGGVPERRLAFETVGHSGLASALDGERILLYEPQLPAVFSLHDTGTGRRLRAFAGDAGFLVRDALLLSSGGVVVLESDGPSNRLRLAVDDATDRLVDLPGGLALLGGELPGGRVAVGVRPEPARAPDGGLAGGDTLIVALATGEVTRRETGLLPAGWLWLRPFRARSRPAAALFESGAGELVRLDPDTGARTVLIAAKSPR